MTISGSLPSQSSTPAYSAGLLRTLLAGTGRTLAEAFANVDRAPGLRQLVRHPHRDAVGARIALQPHEGEGYWDFTRIGDSLYVVVGNFAYKDPRVELLPGDGLIQFYFKLSGDLTMEVSRTEPLRLHQPSLLVYSQPAGLDVQEWTAPSVRERCVAITVQPQYLADNFLGSRLTTPTQLTALLSGDPARLQYSLLPLTTQMFELASRLLENPYIGLLALVHTEALALELLCAAIAGFERLEDGSAQEFTQHDLRCLHAARALLMKQLAPAPTIRQVARAVGMNTTSLKSGFRTVFGETLFAFSVRCRMQEALRLLRDDRMPVARVAEIVGYSHQTSFATAFRRHFGMCPKDVRAARHPHPVHALREPPDVGTAAGHRRPAAVAKSV